MKGEILKKINCFHNKILYVFKIQPPGLRKLEFMLNLFQRNNVLQSKEIKRS